MYFKKTYKKNFRYAPWIFSFLILFYFIFNHMPVSYAQGQKEKVSDLIQQGRIEIKEQKYAEAITTFNEVLKIDAKNVEANFRIGAAYWGQRKAKEALDFIHKAIELDPKNASLRLSLAGFYDQLKMIPQAIKQYKQVIELAKNTKQAQIAEKQLNLALVKEYVSSGDVDTALQLLNSMLEEHPNDPRILQHLGFAYMLVNRYEAAVAIYETVLESEPNNDSAHMNLAGVYEKMGDIESAIIHFETVAQKSESAGRKTEAKIRAGLLRATAAQAKGDFDDAITYLKDILEFRPTHIISSNRLAAAYKDQGKLDLSEEVLLESIKLVPNNIDGRLNLASLFLQKNNMLDAVWSLDNILNIAPNTSTGEKAKKLMQQILQKLGDKFEPLRRAATSKYKLIDLVKQEPENAKARFELAVIYFQQARTKQALHEFEKVREISPDVAGTYLYLGELYAKIQKHKESATAFARYISLNKNIENIASIQLAYASALGQQLFTEKKMELSLNQFQRVLKSEPEDTLANYYSALILAQQGKIEEAAGLYEKVIEKMPGNVGARSNVALIYEQLEKEEEALRHYRKILTSKITKGQEKNIEKKVSFLTKRINGLTTTAGYSMTIDNNSNLSESAPEEENSSSLTANFIYNYKYNDAIRGGVSYALAYTTYNVGQFDLYNQTTNPFVTYTKNKNKIRLSYSYSKLEGILNETNINSSHSYRANWNRTIRKGRKGDLSFSFRKNENANTSRFNANTFTLGGTYDRNLGSGYSDNMGYTYSLNKNEDPLNRDAAYQAHALSYRLTKWLNAKTSTSLSVNSRITNYGEVDRVALTNRQNIFFSISGRVNYRLNQAVRVFGSLNYQLNNSNLPIFICPLRNADRSPVTAEDCRPINTIDIIGVTQNSASLGPYKKAIVSFGVSVSF